MTAKAPLIALSLMMLGAFGLSSPALGQSPAGGMVPLNLTIRGTTTFSLGDDGGDPIDKFSSSKSNWTANDLLKLFAITYGDYPQGAKLQYDPNYGGFLVVDRYGAFVEDLSGDGYMSISLDPNGSATWSGQINNNTGAARFTGTYIAILSFDDQIGDTSESVGLVKETYSITAMDLNGCQRAADSWSMTLVGDGIFQNTASNGTMTINGNGRGTLCNGKLVATESPDPSGESAP